MLSRLAAAAACAALLWCDVAAAQTVINLQGCPPTRNDALTMLSRLAEKSRSSSGTASYATENVRFLGDPVLGIFSDPYNRSWLHIRLPRPPSTYAAAVRAYHAKETVRANCDTPDQGCYLRMDDKRAWGLHSLDFTNFQGRMAKEGEPDGRYLICFY